MAKVLESYTWGALPYRRLLDALPCEIADLRTAALVREIHRRRDIIRKEGGGDWNTYSTRNRTYCQLLILHNPRIGRH